MTLIEGIGDEVIYFVGLACLVIVLALAWSSTSVSEHALIRTAVLVIDRRRRSVINNNNNTTSNAVGVTNNNTETRNRSAHVLNSRSADRSEENHGIADERSSHQTVETPMETNVSSRTETTEQEIVNNEERQAPSEDGPTTDGGHIRVRLKFLNDTQKLVGARLLDQLGQFKQEHFREELGNNKTVRLIFNGQLLQRDQETLQFYGLFDNCVVHCHISSTAETPSTPVFSPPVEMDLSRLMLPLFGLILGLIWCCRIQYRQYFNGTSTFALLCITGLFLVSIFAIWLPTRNANARA